MLVFDEFGFEDFGIMENAQTATDITHQVLGVGRVTLRKHKNG